MGGFHLNWRNQRALTVLGVLSEGEQACHATFNSPLLSFTGALGARSHRMLLTDSRGRTGPRGHGKWDSKYRPKYTESDRASSLAHTQEPYGLEELLASGPPFLVILREAIPISCAVGGNYFTYGKHFAGCLSPHENSMNVSHRRVQVQVFRCQSLCRHPLRRTVRVRHARCVFSS